MKDDLVSCVALITQPFAHEIFEKLSGLGDRTVLWCFEWVEKKNATCVFRKVMLRELLLWVQPSEVFKDCISYLLYVCVHTVQSGVSKPRSEHACPVVKPMANWSKPWGETYGKSQRDLRLAKTMGLWYLVGWLLGVCHSLVHWTLPLHRVFSFYLSLQFLFLSLRWQYLDFTNSASILTVSCANVRQLL